MKAIVLLSGGLDSTLAMRLVLDQGVELHALHFTSVFSPGDDPSSGAVRVAEQYGIPLTIEDITEGLLGLLSGPAHGFGSGVNPCIDCRIMQLRRARVLMGKVGASFVVTGEVRGQRPMSQRLDALRLVEKAAGLEGLVLRPLSALALEPSIPEQEGWVDREGLKGFTGRQRTPQIALAEELGVTDYPNPAGGCRLTEPNFANRMRDLMTHGELSTENARLLAVGRHFRLAPGAKLVVGRMEMENDLIESMARNEDVLLEAQDFPGPISLVRGELCEDVLRTAARITARYGKGRGEPEVIVSIRGRESGSVTVAPATDDDIEALRV
jgi:tRNA U34 2-thiouridine synthase MnmA/TrmU